MVLTYRVCSFLVFTPAVLGLIYLGAAAAFNAFTGSCTILLGLSYIVPIGLSVLEGRKKMKSAPWGLGRFGYVNNIVSCENRTRGRKRASSCSIVDAHGLFTFPQWSG
jgi:hypothetical protein